MASQQPGACARPVATSTLLPSVSACHCLLLSFLHLPAAKQTSVKLLCLQVVNGNYVTAKRRGIVNGIDFGEHTCACTAQQTHLCMHAQRSIQQSLQGLASAPPAVVFLNTQLHLTLPHSCRARRRPAGQMGQVRFVQRGAMEQQLAAGNLVMLTNIGVSSSGELLNCNAFDVSRHAALHCTWHSSSGGGFAH